MIGGPYFVRYIIVDCLLDDWDKTSPGPFTFPLHDDLRAALIVTKSDFLTLTEFME